MKHNYNEGEGKDEYDDDDDVANGGGHQGGWQRN